MPTPALSLATTCDDQAKELLTRLEALLEAEEQALRGFRHRDLDAITQQKSALEEELAQFVGWIREHPSALSPAVRTAWRQRASVLRQRGENNLLRMQHSMTLLQGFTQRLMGATATTYTARRGMNYGQTPRAVLTSTIG